ncbi:endonuclease/exonuclease/phosphatase family protein [Algoriphagus sediminis]|uniref:Endonuclease/exonuclease/phosphatase family protein n=1 Tax=Algoriphagus sediminis TaxID=3057113 RepID=A0ABT7Y970_9BACT|nr:endonuclease/exonuclease/phosphatase family protein [Algoriphagus sediminis]MDN3203061.1 endonuclease/exonuclease/phosphatase family protein [Algoriphagus sediminis]
MRWDNPNDVGNLWKDRLPHVIEVIEKYDIGIVGIQEGLEHQVDQLTEGLGYSFLGVGRDDGAKAGEFTAILYDSEKYDLLDEGTFWLSPTPDIPSKGWDAALNRICSWGKFKDQKGKEFFVFNIHYDHIGQGARVESSKLVLEKTKEINSENYPAVWIGDFNVTPENEAYKVIVDSGWKDTRLVSKSESFGPRNTFTGFEWNPQNERIIDHVFVNSGFSVSKHGIIDDHYGEKYPSDHFPVLAIVEFEEK